MTTHLPKISVITVSFNQGEFIRKNIESVLAQNYPNFEHIIVDGGSTDSTLDVLRSYPHLKWTSEPDRGQSDALNKGFSRATGDIIAWLNSDDWYADNLFHDLAVHMRDYPVLIGQAAQTDRDGNVTQIVQNTARTFYDLLRYWIPLAWVAQTSVFFKRSVLEEVKRPDGTYLDEDLFFTMDLDLWFRIAMKYPFVKHLNRVLSYFRIYDQNKTGARPLATQRECCRVFRRYINGMNPSEHRLSYIIPINHPDEALKKTVISLTQQTSLDFDIFLVDFAQDRQTSKGVHNYALDLCEAVPQITIRYAKSSAPNEYAAFNTGIEKAVAPNVALLQPGDTVSPSTTHEALQIFARDVSGLIFPNIRGGLSPERIVTKDGGINVGEIISGPFFYPNIFARRLALCELNSFRDPLNPGLSVKELLIRAVFRGWSVQSAPQCEITPTSRDYSQELASWESNRDSIVRSILTNLKLEYEGDPFAQVRAAVRDPKALFSPVA
jgi:glycosyltransferase involved in cell wall biosynthesis